MGEGRRVPKAPASPDRSSELDAPASPPPASPPKTSVSEMPENVLRSFQFFFFVISLGYPFFLSHLTILQVQATKVVSNTNIVFFILGY